MTKLLWHVRMGHASVEYLKKLQTKHPGINDWKECKFDGSIRNCEVCLTSKLNRLHFRTMCARAEEPFQISH